MQSAPEKLVLRALKLLGCLAVLMACAMSAQAFSLLGPGNEDYQKPEIGYMLPGDVGAPKNIHEEYRWNIPVIYYAYDQNFLDYFGTNGVNAIEEAIGVFNGLTNTSFEDLDLNQFPLEAFRINPRAQQLNLLDLKSVAMNLIIEELGLAEPERYIWTLRERRTQPGLACPFMIYHVIMRNFDPFTYSPSPYINGVLFTYRILESCNPPNPLAITDNFPPDPATPESTYSAVAGLGAFRDGAYAIGLSRDDAGGLKYLYRRDNVNWEGVPTGAEMFMTNRSQAQLVFSSNLWLFASQALTNNATQLQTLYPGLIITGTTNIYTNVWVTNLTAFFTNYPWTPVDAFPQLIFQTNRTLTVQTHYIHSFANAFTGLETEQGIKLVPVTQNPTASQRVKVLVQSIGITNSPWLPAGQNLVTNVTSQVVYTNGFYGDVFILPTNACSLELLALQATFVNRITNSLTSTTNVLGTNVISNPGDGTGNNNSNFVFQIPQFSQNVITIESNRVWLAYPVECVSSNETLVRGVDRIQFIRTSFDSLIGRYYQPITNIYRLSEVTNSTLVTNVVRRVVRRPDIVFSALDLNATVAFRTVPHYTTNGINSGLAGPGTLEPSIEIGFNKVGPLLVNYYEPDLIDFGLNQASSFTNFMWGSFNGSTNEPIIYPFGTALSDIEDILLFQIVSFDLPEGSVGVPYAAQLQAAGGRTPYYWEPAMDSAPLPPGLTISAEGVISGTPEEEGDYTFSVSVTEAGGRTTTRTLTIRINP